MEINERIKNIRTTSGLTQMDFGLRIGVKGGAVSMLESGQRYPSGPLSVPSAASSMSITPGSLTA